MSSITAEEAKALAPDLASLKAAQELADICHWVSLGANEAALWGECKGSAQKPYKVQVDLSNRGFACTCPSRKSPCKHVLGLMLLASASPTILKDATPPAWVSEWLEKRTDQTSDHAGQAEPDTASSQSRQKDAARRAARREKLVAAGLETLDLWLKDLIRQGLAFAQSAPASFWDSNLPAC
jgi:SWIM zinc finger.